MAAYQDKLILRIYAAERGCRGDGSVGRRLVAFAKRHGLAGASVVRGIMGFGRSGQLHRVTLRKTTSRAPVIIQIVDDPDKITAFLQQLEDFETGGLVTVQRVAAAQM